MQENKYDRCPNMSNKHNFIVPLKSLVKFLAEAHRGVHGFVVDEHGNPIEKASLKIKGRDVGFQTTKYGEFWRILLPGVYKIEVSCTSIVFIFIFRARVKLVKFIKSNSPHFWKNTSSTRQFNWPNNRIPMNKVMFRGRRGGGLTKLKKIK